MVIDEAPENVMTIGELHWILSTSTLSPRFQAPSVSPQSQRNVALKFLQTFVEKIDYPRVFDFSWRKENKFFGRTVFQV